MGTGGNMTEICSRISKSPNMSTNEGSSSLKQQFQSLQEQQQKKLARRKQIKEEKNKGKDNKKLTDTQASIAFGVNDDLDLKLPDPPLKSESIYSEELVLHLNDQIRELKDETGRLYKLLSERDLELRMLRKKHSEDKVALAGATTGSTALVNETAATKIVDLSKRVRELTAELEAERTKTKQYAKKCLDLQNERGVVDSNSKKTSLTGSRASLDSRQPPSEEQLKLLQEKLKQSELKMAEHRNQTQALRQELKMAQKVVSQEVGEGVSIQSLVSGSTGWRGRAQQITALQKKVNDLRSQMSDQLHQQQKSSRADPDADLEAEMMGVSRRGADEKQREQIRKIEKERKEAQEKQATELKALEADYEEMKKRMDASKARNKVLSSEVKSHKHQVQTLMDKGKHDDELIEALLKQLGQLKQALEDSGKKQRQQEASEEKVSKQLSLKGQQEHNVIEQLKAIVAEREGKVRTLEQELKQMKLEHLQKAQLNGIHALFEPGSSSARPHTGGSRPPTAASLAESVQDLLNASASNPPSRLSDVAGSLSRQTTKDSELTMSGTDRSSPRKASARPGSAQAAVMDMEELKLQCQEYKSLCQASTVERDKLREHVQVLQKRIDESATQATEVQTEIVAQRRKNVQLEKQLGKVRVEQGQSAKKSKAKGSVSSLRESAILDQDSTSGQQQSVEEIETSLAIQRDENEALKMALQSTLQAKEEDLRLYTEMIDQTKTIFLQGLRQFRQQQQQQPL